MSIEKFNGPEFDNNESKEHIFNTEKFENFTANDEIDKEIKNGDKGDDFETQKQPSATLTSEEADKIYLNTDIKKLIDNNWGITFKREEVIKGLLKTILNIEKKTDIAQYDTVFSDDASARPLSLFIKEIIDKRRKDSGEDKSKIYFIGAGQGGVKNKITNKFIEKFIMERKGDIKKVLLVTELVDEGVAGTP